MLPNPVHSTNTTVPVQNNVVAKGALTHTADAIDMDMSVHNSKYNAGSETVRGQPDTIPAPKMTVDEVKTFFTRRDIQAKKLSITLAISLKKLRAFKNGTRKPNERELTFLSEFRNSIWRTIQKGKQWMLRQETAVLQPSILSTDRLTTERLTEISNLVTTETGEYIELVQLRKFIHNTKYNNKKST